MIEHRFIVLDLHYSINCPESNTKLFQRVIFLFIFALKFQKYQRFSWEHSRIYVNKICSLVKLSLTIDNWKRIAFFLISWKIFNNFLIHLIEPSDQFRFDWKACLFYDYFLLFLQKRQYICSSLFFNVSFHLVSNVAKSFIYSLSERNYFSGGFLFLKIVLDKHLWHNHSNCFFSRFKKLKKL